MSKFISEITVREVMRCGSDAHVAAAAWVSTSAADGLKKAEADPAAVGGLIRYLMKHRHGCYDSETEVLTDAGWKRWPDVTGRERFLTINPSTDEIEWQRAERLVHKSVNEDMVRVQMDHVDLFVTYDHNMLAARRTHSGDEKYQLLPAHELLEASHRIRMGGGEWAGQSQTDALPLRLIGFFIGDGWCPANGASLEFHLRKTRKIDYLREVVADGGWNLETRGTTGDKYVVSVPTHLRRVFAGCYTEDGEKRIPSALLNLPAHQLEDLFDGLIQSDGHISASGKVTYSTTSHLLAGQLQELAVKIGRAATVHPHPFTDDDARFGTKSRWRVTIYRERNARPRIGWTVEDRRRQVRLEHYTGVVYCVTVPNGTLYVRRNGIPCWCGNSPFEHGMLTLYVHAPIFVWREWHRHRWMSFNEESARYKVLDPVFYVPPRDRPMMKVEIWKAGRPKFLPCEADATHDELCANLKESYRVGYEMYDQNLALGIDPGLARDCLPVGIYSSCWVTANPRSLMHFLSLRTHEPTAAAVSYPLWEIEQAARKVEAIFAQHWPITHAAFCENGRVAP